MCAPYRQNYVIMTQVVHRDNRRKKKDNENKKRPGTTSDVRTIGAFFPFKLHLIYISIYLYFSFPNISAQLFISGVSTFPLTPTYN